LFLILILLISFIPYTAIGLIVFVFGRKQLIEKDYFYHPTVTVYLPTYNEEKNIARKLDNLLQQTYPIDEILIYDCSDDSTKQIILDYQKRHGNIKLVDQKERIGMARTLNEALNTSKGEIIIKTDCDSLAKSKDSLKELISSFSDQKIGGVSGICVNKGVEGDFRSFMTRLQVAESNIDSTIVAHATSFLAFRKGVIEDVNPDSVADDTEEFVLIRKKGYRTIIDSAVCSEEELPKSFRDRRLQKDRRSQGIVEVMLRNFSVLFNPKYGYYGLVVFPMDFFLLVISPFVILLDIALIGYQLFLINSLLLVPYALILVLPFALYNKRKLSPLVALIDLQLAGLLGTLYSIIGKSGAKWKRVR
jgi:cellulose synthase/poly-beta-1,6-N-acetylglucosamine synthase-like glycosyltransferase